MKYKYIVEKKLCPNCGYNFKSTIISRNPFHGYLILLTAGNALLWYIGIAIMKAIFGAGETPELGSPYALCPKCEKKVKTNEKQLWTDFSDEQKKAWSFRNKFRVCYVLSGFVFMFLLFQLFWLSSFESDHNFALVFLILLLISMLIIVWIVFSWKKCEQVNYIVVSDYDFEEILETINEYKKETKKEYKETISIITRTGKRIKAPQIKEREAKDETLQIEKKKEKSSNQKANGDFVYCVYCGEKNLKNHNYCSDCGKKLLKQTKGD